MGMLENVLGCRIIIILKEMDQVVVYNLKKYLITLSALDLKFLQILLMLIRLDSIRWCKISVYIVNKEKQSALKITQRI
jgi:hypothetical protein